MTDPLPPLASSDDVVKSLGVNDISGLPSTMVIRMPGTLAKVSRRFRKEAQRIFTPGTYTHDIRIHAGAVRLMEKPDQIRGLRVAGLSEFDWVTGDPILGPAWTVEGSWLVWSDWRFWRLNGRIATVTYSWDTPVPLEVVTAVGDITGRNLAVDPLSPLPQSKMLMSRYHRQDVAGWVSDGATGFTKDDIAQAQSYRYPAPTVIVANLTSGGVSPSQAFLSDSSW